MKEEKQNSQNAGTNRLVLIFAVVLLATACKKEMEPTDDNRKDPALSQAIAKAPKLVVHAGGSIQAAIDNANAGTAIKIEAGTYQESLTINKPGITLTGDDGVVLQNPGNKDYGIIIGDGADGVALKNITIRDFKERAVFMTHVDGFLFSHVTVINDGEFGLFAEYCKNGLIEHCEGTQHRETSVFIGQSINVTVTKSKSYANVIGFEVENSSHVTFEENHAYNNSVGIMCLLVPGRITKEASNLTFSKNRVRDNNLPNFSVYPEMESFLPSGVGILILGAKNTLVEENQVTNHQFTGVAVISSLVMGVLTGLPPEAFAGIEPNPDHVSVVKNLVKDNGFAPPAGLPFPGVDLLWDGSGNNNCWSRNIYNTSYPAVLPACL